MFNLIKPAVTSLAISALVVAPMGVGLSVLWAEPAFAKNGNGNGNGGNKGNNGGGNGKSATAGKSASAGSKSNGRGALNSELKWLNAANASPKALANADPNSNVGRIATYQTETKQLVSDIETLMREQQALADLQSGYTGRTSAQIQADLDVADQTDTALINDLKAELAAAKTQEAAVATQQGVIATQEGVVNAQAGVTEAALLTATRGKMLSAEALAELNRRLGI